MPRKESSYATTKGRPFFGTSRSGLPGAVSAGGRICFNLRSSPKKWTAVPQCVNPPEKTAPHSPPGPGRLLIFRRPALWPGAILVCATFIAYFPAIKGGLIWDDDAHLTKGPNCSRATAFGGYGLRSARPLAILHPVLHTAFWLEHHRLWGKRGGGVSFCSMSFCMRQARVCSYGPFAAVLGRAGPRLRYCFGGQAAPAIC